MFLARSGLETGVTPRTCMVITLVPGPCRLQSQDLEDTKLSRCLSPCCPHRLLMCAPGHLSSLCPCQSLSQSCSGCIDRQCLHVFNLDGIILLFLTLIWWNLYTWSMWVHDQYSYKHKSDAQDQAHKVKSNMKEWVSALAQRTGSLQGPGQAELQVLGWAS